MRYGVRTRRVLELLKSWMREQNQLATGTCTRTLFYGHCVTTVKLVTGMAGLAVITGLIFVRFARPTAKILFSKSAVIAPFDLG
jgi:hypothetical protein